MNMRPQQNRRVRGHNNNNHHRRSPNPLSRNYESNGPDIKVRGNAQQIADKYISLSYDAQGAGDRVMFENYLQHAEHYLRIILAAAEQMPPQNQRDENLDQECEDGKTDDTKKEELNGEQPVSYAQVPRKNDRRKGREKPRQNGDALEIHTVANANCGLEQPPVAKKPAAIKKTHLAEFSESENEEIDTIVSLPSIKEEVRKKPRRRSSLPSYVEEKL